MAVTFFPYGLGLKHILLGDVDFEADTLKVAFLTSAYPFDPTTHEFFSDITHELTTGGGYTAGGVALTGKVVGFNAAGTFGYLDADPLVIDPATFTAAKAVLYKSTGSPASSILLGYVDFDGDQTPAAEEFRIEWAAPSAGGVYRVSGA